MLPGITPVTNPSAFTVAIDVLVELQTPVFTVSENGIVDPAQIELEPLIIPASTYDMVIVSAAVFDMLQAVTV